MKQEMCDAVMTHGGVHELPAVLRRTDDHEILREHVDLEDVQESRRIGLVIEREVGL